MAYLSKLFALEGGGGDYKLDKSNLIAPCILVRPQQVDLWVRVRGTPFPHIRTYISQDQAGPWYTQLQILDLPVLELNPLNFNIF
jgi:hypothetical protein